ncbi:MAG: MFS transporter [Undibacterium sp.]|nr:MFS transporter [Opitutaceae bacterium]
MTASASAATAPKRENLLINIVCNIVVPTLVLTKLSGDNRLGPLWGLLVALMFPLGYGVYDFARRRKANFISILGIVSVLLTGGLGLMKVGGFWFAVKDAAVPGLIGLSVLISMKTKSPLLKEMFFNEQIVDVQRVETALVAHGKQSEFERLIVRSSLWLVGAFLLSSVLNYGLARHLLISPPGTPEFNAELGRMHVLSWPVIVVPSMAVMALAFWKLVRGLKKLTGLTMDEIFRGEPEKKPDSA